MAARNPKRRRESGDHSDGIDPTHAVAVLTKLAQMYREGCRTDLVVVVGERRFEVHGCVLMCGSEFFRTQLQTGVGARIIHEVTLPEMSARTFELIIECLYTGVLGSIDASNAMELLEASRRLQVDIAEAQCCEWLEEHLDVSNAVVVWESARRLGCEAVQAKAWPVVGRHLAEVARQEAFLALPQPLLVELVRDDSLAVRSEVAVYEAVMGWVRSDEARRKGSIGEVLGTVRLGLLPAQYIAENVATDPLIAPSGDASRVLAKAFSYHVTSAIRDGAAPDSIARARNWPAGAVLIVVGGSAADDASVASAECYDPLTQQWQALPGMSVARRRGAGACVDGLVYVVGGVNQNSLASAECYDPSTRQWRALPEMSVERYGCAAACVDGLLYVVGGRDAGDNILASAECYDPSTQQWRALPDMRGGRYECAAACVDGLLYVAGGGAYCAECYDPSTRRWRTLPDMDAYRGSCVAACVGGLFYVVDVQPYRPDFLASAQCYDPSTQEWRALPDMSVPRAFCAAACVDGLLYIVGGRGEIYYPNGAVTSVECYDPSAQQWRTLPGMQVGRSSCVAVRLG
jgi:N-acetylneuraminic acid mutarotase